MALAVQIIEGHFIISDADLRDLAGKPGTQAAISKVRGSMVVYQETWTAEQATAFVAAAVGKQTPAETPGG